MSFLTYLQANWFYYIKMAKRPAIIGLQAKLYFKIRKQIWNQLNCVIRSFTNTSKKRALLPVRTLIISGWKRQPHEGQNQKKGKKYIPL